MQPSDDNFSLDWTIVAPAFGPVLDLDGLAKLLHRDRATILADRCRAPQRVPPAHKPPGTKEPLWLLDEVLHWLRAHPDLRAGAKPAVRRAPGRPLKAEQVWRARAKRVVVTTDQEGA